MGSGNALRASRRVVWHSQKRFRDAIISLNASRRYAEHVDRLGTPRMKIYTKTGDSGETGLFAGARVAKDHVRIEAYGTVDELNACLGVARAARPPVDVDDVLERVQHELFALGAELATPDPAANGLQWANDAVCEGLEREIDRFEALLPPLRQFILPGGEPSAAAIHQARAVCRRAERCVVTLRREDAGVSEHTVIYLNRLGDLLFVLARAANRLLGVDDVAWRKPSTSA